MSNLGRGKLYYNGGENDIEKAARLLRDKTYPQFLRKSKGADERYLSSTHGWLWYIIDQTGGDVRYCDPMAYSGPTYCDKHGVITIYERGNFLIHCSALMGTMYNNFIVATAFGFYFLNYDEIEKDVIFGWPDSKIAWQARRFAAALVLPEREVFEYLETKLKYNLNSLNLRNYEDLVSYFTNTVSGHFSIPSEPTRIRLGHLFYKRAKEKEAGLTSFTSA